MVERVPVQVIGWHRATLAAEVETDREEVMMFRQRKFVPGPDIFHLGLERVQINVHATPDRLGHRRRPEFAGDVDQQIR